jgi:hypothetical protein
MTQAKFDPWSPENRQKAADRVLDSIQVLEDLQKGWSPDLSSSPEDQAEMKKQVYDANLQFLKNTLKEPYYEGFLDTKRVEDAIAAAEAAEIS